MEASHRGGGRDLFGLALLIGAAVALWLVWSPPSANDLVAGDEGYYGTMARSALAGPRWMVSPPLAPLGPPGDKPPLYPAVLALSIRTFGPSEWALRWPSLLCAAWIALAAGWLARRASSRLAAWAATLMLLTLPWFADASRVAAAEPPLTALAMTALIVAESDRRSITRGAIAGVLLGLAFLCKLWLVALIALPVLVLLSAKPRRVSVAVAAILSAIVVASAHLVLVARIRPADLAHWLSVYFVNSLAARAGGEGYVAYWLKPPGYYWTLLVHATGLLLPLVAVGFDSALRRRSQPLPRALVVWALTVFAISAFRVKAGGYAYPIVPAWMILAGLGAADLAAGRRPRPWAPAICALASLPAVCAWLGGTPLPWPVWAGAWGAFVLGMATPGVTARRAFGVGYAVAACLLGFVRESQRLPTRYHEVGYREIAAAVAPLLEGVPPTRDCFIGPEAPALSYYLFRSGFYWSTPGAPWTPAKATRARTDTALRVFVIDPSRSFYGGWPDSTMLAWLEDSTREVSGVRTRTGRALPFRVFVRDGAR